MESVEQTTNPVSGRASIPPHIRYARVPAPLALPLSDTTEGHGDLASSNGPVPPSTDSSAISTLSFDKLSLLPSAPAATPQPDAESQPPVFDAKVPVYASRDCFLQYGVYSVGAGEECSICREQGERIMRARMCGHQYGEVCLGTWLHNSAECPECRRIWFTDPIINIVPYNPHDYVVNPAPGSLLSFDYAYACTLPGCGRCFRTDRFLRRHQSEALDHWYCRRCNMVFGDVDDLVHHRQTTPDKHKRACPFKFCETETRCDAGLHLHIKMVSESILIFANN